ncbi:MAG: hypothetical protein TH68_02055 [Candidatus Synechococcus spongiarum 142]|uniref:Uncharacterized protein n=1 Tax=Candidatus Synechococcus spongiarum 142 TaxID=1608213 RepID=A0A6N3X219_9SYNE|nr:MAG: hypothetical protein TH68_02055 [Candidatus Synechococcus spongiarum 142]
MWGGPVALGMVTGLLLVATAGDGHHWPCRGWVTADIAGDGSPLTGMVTAGLAGIALTLGFGHHWGWTPLRKGCTRLCRSLSPSTLKGGAPRSIWVHQG